ncbi:MAG: hypothetical protein HYZ49_05835 [Chloroflexi bacterium]|nr:hypothetical protein [Chloroflexota bacterium]
MLGFKRKGSAQDLIKEIYDEVLLWGNNIGILEHLSKHDHYPISSIIEMVSAAYRNPGLEAYQNVYLASGWLTNLPEEQNSLRKVYELLINLEKEANVREKAIQLIAETYNKLDKAAIPSSLRVLVEKAHQCLEQNTSKVEAVDALRAALLEEDKENNSTLNNLPEASALLDYFKRLEKRQDAKITKPLELAISTRSTLDISYSDERISASDGTYSLRLSVLIENRDDTYAANDLVIRDNGPLIPPIFRFGGNEEKREIKLSAIKPGGMLVGKIIYKYETDQDPTCQLVTNYDSTPRTLIAPEKTIDVPSEKYPVPEPYKYDSVAKKVSEGGVVFLKGPPFSGRTRILEAIKEVKDARIHRLGRKTSRQHSGDEEIKSLLGSIRDAKGPGAVLIDNAEVLEEEDENNKDAFILYLSRAVREGCIVVIAQGINDTWDRPIRNALPGALERVSFESIYVGPCNEGECLQWVAKYLPREMSTLARKSMWLFSGGSLGVLDELCSALKDSPEKIYTDRVKDVLVDVALECGQAWCNDGVLTPIDQRLLSVLAGDDFTDQNSWTTGLSRQDIADSSQFSLVNSQSLWLEGGLLNKLALQYPDHFSHTDNTRHEYVRKITDRLERLWQLGVFWYGEQSENRQYSTKPRRVFWRMGWLYVFARSIYKMPFESEIEARKSGAGNTNEVADEI